MTYRLIDLLEEKKEKTGISLLRQWLWSGKVLNEIEVAKVLSTTLTHCLINVEHVEDPEEAVNMALGYHCDILATMIKNLVTGQTSIVVCKKIIEDIFDREQEPTKESE